MTSDYYRDAKWPPHGTADALCRSVKAKHNTMSVLSTPIMFSTYYHILLMLHKTYIWIFLTCHSSSFAYLLCVTSDTQFQLIPSKRLETSNHSCSIILVVNMLSTHNFKYASSVRALRRAVLWGGMYLAIFGSGNLLQAPIKPTGLSRCSDSADKHWLNNEDLIHRDPFHVCNLDFDPLVELLLLF